MNIYKYTPTDRLKPFIKTFMILESEHDLQNRILPDTSVVMVFRYKGNSTYSNGLSDDHLPLSAITGLRKSARLINYSKNTANLLVIFHEAGPSAFFEVPVHELFGSTIALDNIFPKHELAEIEEKLFEAPSNRQRFKLVEQFLLSKLRVGVPDQLVVKAIQNIKLIGGNLSIKNLAEGLFISRDPFEKRFRKLTGTSPKHFASIIRLRSLISTYSNSVSFTEMAYQAGYFDQSHFIKDFKSFTGLTPQAFFQSGRYW